MHVIPLERPHKSQGNHKYHAHIWRLLPGYKNSRSDALLVKGTVTKKNFFFLKYWSQWLYWRLWQHITKTGFSKYLFLFSSLNSRMSMNMCIWRHKLCNAKTGVGPTFTFSNEPWLGAYYNGPNSNVNLQVIQGDFPIKYGPKTLKHPSSIS